MYYGDDSYYGGGIEKPRTLPVQHEYTPEPKNFLKWLKWAGIILVMQIGFALPILGIAFVIHSLS